MDAQGEKSNISIREDSEVVLLSRKWLCRVSTESANGANFLDAQISGAQSLADPFKHCLTGYHAKGSALLMVITLSISSALAYSQKHIGKYVLADFALQGCRGRYLQDISCSGVFSPEYYVFACGLSICSSLYAIAFHRTAQIIGRFVGRRSAVFFEACGVLGCVFSVLTAWISMGMNRHIHLSLATCTFILWCMAFAVRTLSGLPPFWNISAITFVVTILTFVIWVCGYFANTSLAVMEWIGLASTVIHSFTFPVEIKLDLASLDAEPGQVQLRTLS